jgi:rhodanese-related sulfurtransferase
MMVMSHVDNNIGLNELLHVSAREAMQLLNTGAILIDVRPEYELGRLFDVERVIYCPYKEILDQLSELPRDELLIVSDAVGLRSKEIATMLLGMGFQNIAHLAGGIVDWERDGFPVTKDKTRILSGPCMCQLKPRSKN